MDKQKNLSKEQKLTYIFYGIIAFLVIAVAFFGYKYKSESNELTYIQNKLTIEKDSLRLELLDLSVDYDSLRSENDTMNLKLDVEKAKIDKLLAMRKDNLSTIRTYRKELGTLRVIMKDYIREIDSLSQANIALVQENKQVKSTLSRFKQNNAKLSEEKDKLTSTVETASKLTAKDIVVIPQDKRSREKYSYSRVVKLRTCFVIRENPIIEAGDKTIYIKIIRPDGITLTSTEVSTIEFEGKNIPVSARRVITYENKDIDVCIFWNNNGELIPGNYTAEVYTDDLFLGKTTFVLK